MSEELDSLIHDLIDTVYLAECAEDKQRYLRDACAIADDLMALMKQIERNKRENQ